MKSYSVDLRQRVADAVLQDHLPWAQVARSFRLSMASVGRFVRARRRGQDLTPRHSSGRPRRFDRPEKLVGHLSKSLPLNARPNGNRFDTWPTRRLAGAMGDEPDLALVERCQRLRQDHGLQVSEATLSRVVRSVLG